MSDPLVPLRQATARHGGKAAGLGRLLRHGLPVPDGVVVPDPLGDDRWGTTLGAAVRGLGPGPFAVRSSALGEDGPTASFAGQLATLLDVAAPDVPDAVREVARSGTGPGVTAYGRRTGRTLQPVVPVVVQAMVRATVAGVLFTRHPVSGAHVVLLEAHRGPAAAVVEGTVTPQAWVVDDAVTPPADAAPALTAAQARRLARTGRRIETLLGRPQDVEWAFTDDRLWVLQARPITTSPAHVPAAGPRPGSLLVTGTAAGGGTATGTARVVTGLDGLPRVTAGDVLVCRATSPAWTPAIARAAAVVTDVGGILSHAAIVARELGIPAVTATGNGTRVVPDGVPVAVDGTRGTVTEPDPHRTTGEHR